MSLQERVYYLSKNEFDYERIFGLWKTISNIEKEA